MCHLQAHLFIFDSVENCRRRYILSAWHLLYKITSPALKMGHSSGWNGARGAVGYRLRSPGADIYFEAKGVGKTNFEKKQNLTTDKP